MSDLRDFTLRLSGVSFSYPSSGKRAVSSVSLSVARGEYVALLGANGSGKSTLARLAAGLLTPDSGTVSLAPAIAPFRVPVGMVFQSPGDQIVAETVELDVAFGPENLGLSRDTMRTVVSGAIGKFGLAGLDRERSSGLPTGRKQHLALAAVDALAPALLVLDEPTSMLSEAARESFLGYLDRLRDSGVTILHITHDLDEAVRADRAVALDDGAVAFDGTPGELLALGNQRLFRLGLAAEPDDMAPNAGSGYTVTETAPEADGGAFEAVAGPDAPEKARSAGNSFPDPALSFRDLAFGPIQGLSSDLHPRTVTAVTGESGSGKTLLLELLSGLRSPSSGEVVAAGGLSPRGSVALAVQESESSLFAEFVADDVAWGPRNAGVTGEALKARVREAMNLAGLPFSEFADRRTFSLSGGERRKAALAGIIAMDAPVILLDEPFAALDVRSRAQLARLIVRLRAAGKAVAFTATRDGERAIADRTLSLPPPTRSAASAAAPAGTRAEAAVGNPVLGAARGKRTPVDRDLRSLERLRAGEAGSWAPGDSFVHRLSPLAKFVVALSLVVASIAVKGWPALCVLVALMPVPLLAARLDPKRFLAGFLRVLPWLAVLAGIQYLFLRDPSYAVDFLLRFAALYGVISAFVAVTSHTEMMYGIEDFLSPLGVFGVPVRDLSLVTGIVFRFISLLYGEASRITVARLVRSGHTPTKRRRGLLAAAASAASLFVPLMLRTLTRAERLAEAIHARYYGTGKNSRYLYWKSGIPELILMIAAPLFAGSLIFLSRR